MVLCNQGELVIEFPVVLISELQRLGKQPPPEELPYGKKGGKA